MESLGKRSKMKGVGLVVLGVIAGVLLSLNLSAIAQRDSAKIVLPKNTPACRL